jgi:hypothetical protein
VVIAVLGLMLTGARLHVQRCNRGLACRCRRDARGHLAASGALLSYLGPNVDRLRLLLLGRRNLAEPTGDSPAARYE